MQRAAIHVPKVILNNGLQLPKIGLGTWQAGPGETCRVVKDAIDAGYRHFDCAWAYGNEKEIGVAIRDKIADGTVKRDDLFITTKLWNSKHDPAVVVDACKTSLTNFGLKFIDLFLIHWPTGFCDREYPDFFPPNIEEYFTDVDYVDTWQAMEKCVELGLTRSIGLSNFNTQQIDRVLEKASIKPVVNQIEAHPNLNQKKLIAFCKARGMEVVAYSPLGSPTRPWAKPTDPVVRLDDPTFVNIGKKYGKTSAQVILRYLIEIGLVPIPKSANKERLTANLNIFDFQLTPEEIAQIDKYDCNGRICSVEECKNHKYYPFNIEY